MHALLNYWELYPPPGESLSDIVRGLFEVKQKQTDLPAKPKRDKSFHEQAAELAMWDARLR